MVAQRLSVAVTFVLLALCGVTLAMYPPVAPMQGTYTWELTDNQGNDYSGGRTIYDYVSGYVRMESWNTPDANPGINGVTIWDMRESQPVVWTIDQNVNCFSEVLDSNVQAPTAPDFSSFSFSKITYFNRALAEMWSDGFGGVVYVDVFSRDIVGMGNVSTSEDGDLFWNILSWTDKKPDGTEFLLPNTIACKAINSTKRSVDEASEASGLGCILCKTGVKLVLGRICSGGGAGACSAFPPAIPFCSMLANAACKNGGKLSAAAACKIIKKC
jgi:hypothetical protein